MPIEENKLLVITPQPFNYESLRGFLLRVSEENGYTSPSSIAKLMGIKESVLRSRKLPTDHLAKLLGEISNKLDRYSYITKDQKSTSSLKILEHVLESNYAHLQLRSGAQFCPICAKEDGHIDAFWDLGIALACPTHNVKPLSRCAKCCRTISWFRPGLNSCDCGADYSKAPLEKSEPMHTELLKIIHTKLHNKSILDLPNKYQFPLVHFEKLSLGQLLSILYKFGGMSKFYDFGADFESYDGDTSPYAAKALKVGAIIFSAWPNGYVEFLHRYFNNVDTLGRKYLQSTQYKRLVDELAGNNLANRSGDFLIDELLLFGSTELKFPKPSYTPKTRKIRALMNTFSYYKGFDDAPLEEQLLYSGKTILKPEEAAKCIGLPINVMELFWSSGVMKNYLHSEISKSMKFPWFKEVVNEILETIKSELT